MSVFEMTAGSVDVNVTFLSPVEVCVSSLTGAGLLDYSGSERVCCVKESDIPTLPFFSLFRCPLERAARISCRE